jgi:DNA-directed RNA polymerase specialized sigma24 family protein
LTVSQRRQLVDDAATAAVEKWEDAILSGKAVRDWDAWVGSVARNAAKRLGKARNRVMTNSSSLLSAVDSTRCGRRTKTRGNAREARRVLDSLAKSGSLLRGRQPDVVNKLAEPGMSLRRAARELDMPTFNVRRAFESALRRLRAVRTHE